jgi:predicted ATPase
MITKIEIDGFKTFRKFKMEFSPLTVIAGTNASGKSNLFDALQLLSRLAETDLRTAFSEQRGEASELFTQYSDHTYSTEIKFGVEMLIDKEVRDKFGGEAKLKYTRLRYELKIWRTKNERGLEDLFVAEENLNPLRHNEDIWVTSFIPKSTLEHWRPKVGTGKRGVPYIATKDRGIEVPQDGRAGIKREFARNNITQTILSSFNSVDFPHVLAAKEEIRSWRFLQLNPEELRKPSSYLAKDTVTSTGENLAAALHRIKVQDEQAIKDISRKLNSLLPDLIDLDVVDDKVGKQFIITVKSQDGREFTSRVLSEGTLRLLTLCVFEYDDAFQGVLCFEEPENGIHPARLEITAELLKDLAADFEDIDAPLRQVIVNTHSPVLVGEILSLKAEKVATVWFSDLVTLISNKKAVRITKCYLWY